MTSPIPDVHPYVSDPSVCRSERIARFHAYWRSLCPEGALPSREQVDPSDIKPLLPNVIIVDIEQEPLRVRYRLVGTAVVAASRREITGRYLDELRFDRPDDRSLFEDGYRLLLETRMPVFGRIVWSALEDLSLLFESAIFPLSADGYSIDKAIAVEHFVDVDPREIAARVPSRPVRDDD